MHINCPHCQNPIEIVGEPAAEVVCPSCGSSINLDPNRTTTFLPGAPRQVGKFTLLEHLGAGGFGNVFKARDTELDRIVALKIPRAGNVATQEDADRFLREARSAAQLKHPGIVSLYDAGQHDGTYYLVSEFIQGTTLTDRLSAGRLTFRQAAKLLADVADALHYAHERGVVHRDVKPSNIMLEMSESVGVARPESAKGVAGARDADSPRPSRTLVLPHDSLRPKLMDFGLAKRDAGEITMTLDGQVLGTPAYMPPEQARGEGHSVDARGDVYSLGVILYELLTGELPFRGSSRMLIVQVLQDEPRPPRRLNDKIPRDLETICLKAMSKTLARRYATARDLADDLRRWLSGQPIAARPVGNAERLWRWCRRNPMVSGLSAAVLLLLLGVTVVSVTAFVLTKNALDSEIVAKDDAKRSLQESRHQLALNYVQRGVALAEAGKPSTGMAWLLRAMETTDTEDPLRGSILNLMAGWAESLGVCLNHDSYVSAVAFSPDGKTVLIGCNDNSARLWDAATGEPRGAPLRHEPPEDASVHIEGPINAVTFSPDAKTVVTGGADHTARLWDVATGKQRGKPLCHEEGVVAVSFSPDGKTVLTGSYDKTARLWDAATGEPRGVPLRHEDLVTDVAFSPDSKTVLTGSLDDTARLWDAATGEPRGEPLRHTSGGVNAVAFSPDGQTVLTASVFTFQLWDAASGERRCVSEHHENGVTAVAFSPDGATVLAGDGDRAHLWDVTTDHPIGFGGWLRHAALVESVAFSPDGKMVLTCSDDNTAKLWDAKEGERIGVPLRHEGPVHSAVFSPDGKTFLTGSEEKTARLWDVPLGKVQGVPLRTEASETVMSISPDGKTVLTSNREQTARLWDAATGQPRGEPLLHEKSRVTTAVFSTDGKMVVTGSGGTSHIGGDPTGSKGGTAWLWDAATGEPRGTLRHELPVSAIAISPDGKTVLTGCWDNIARVWDATTGKQRGPDLHHEGTVNAVAFSSDGQRVLTGSSDGTARLWDAVTGEPCGAALRHEDIVLAVAFSPDGKTVLTGSRDQTARLWDAATSEPRGQPLLHEWEVHTVAFSPEGKTVLTGDNDSTVRLWDAATGEPRGAPLRPDRGLLFVAFSADGKTLLTGSHDGTAQHWNIPPAFPDEPERIRCYVDVQTAQHWDVQGVLRPLAFDDWLMRRKRLDQLGGPPIPWHRR